VYVQDESPEDYFGEGGAGEDITPLKGSVYIDTSDDNNLYMYSGTDWETIKVEALEGITRRADVGEDWLIAFPETDTIGKDADDRIILPEGAWLKGMQEEPQDNDLVTKKYVDDSIPGFGDYATKALDTAYEAETDGFVIAMHADCDASLGGYIGASEETLVIVAQDSSFNKNYDNVKAASIMFPVKAGAFWKVKYEMEPTDGTTKVNWMPVGA